jgi:hypothetical protein
MKSLQQYFYEAKKVYEFKVKVAIESLDSTQLKKIRNALDAYKLEEMSAPKRLPISEHRDFPKEGPCQCYLLDIAVGYPTREEEIRQLIINRTDIGESCVRVYPKTQYETNEEFEAYGKDHEGSLLDKPDLKDVPGSQKLVGAARVDSMLKELETRKYAFAKAQHDAKGETTNTLPTNDKSPVGSKQNSIPSPVKG